MSKTIRTRSGCPCGAVVPELSAVSDAPIQFFVGFREENGAYSVYRADGSDMMLGGWVRRNASDEELTAAHRQISELQHEVVQRKKTELEAVQQMAQARERARSAQSTCDTDRWLGMQRADEFVAGGLTAQLYQRCKRLEQRLSQRFRELDQRTIQQAARALSEVANQEEFARWRTQLRYLVGSLERIVAPPGDLSGRAQATGDQTLLPVGSLASDPASGPDAQGPTGSGGEV